MSRARHYVQPSVVWCLWADVKRRRGDLEEAERGFRAAVRRLAEVPGDVRARENERFRFQPAAERDSPELLWDLLFEPTTGEEGG